MTSIAVPNELVDEVVRTSTLAGLRPPSDILGVVSPRTIVYTPDLSASEQTTFDSLRALARAATLRLTPADWAAISPRCDTLRVFRQKSQAEFMAKTANQRDRELFDATNDLIAIVLRLLRD